MAKLTANVTKENPGEMYFRWYCEELLQYGYLESFDRELEKFSILPDQVHRRERHLKTKENQFEEFNLLQAINYTYDFRLVWTEKALNLFTEIYIPDGYFVFGQPEFISHRILIDDVPKIVSYVDVKPHVSAAQFGGGKNASYYTFPFIQKFLMYTRGLYINKVIPTHAGKNGVNTCLFAKTFVPNRYRYTDSSGDLRKIPYRQHSIVSYCTQRQGTIDEVLRDKHNKNSQQTLL